MADILIVDDDPQATELLHDTLAHFGYDSAVCEDAASALKLIERERPRLVLLDLALPGSLNGWQLLKGIRKIAPDTACVAITAYDSTTVEHSARQSGFNDYFAKPIDPFILAVIAARFGEEK